MNKSNKNKKGKKLIATNNKKTHILVPLIAMLVIISTIVAICVGAPFGRPSETANLNKNVDNNEEEIWAATSTTVNPGGTYTAQKEGIYKIELHGGKGASGDKSEGGKGDKVIGYVKLNKDDILTFENLPGGAKGSSTRSGAGGDGIAVMKRYN